MSCSYSKCSSKPVFSCVNCIETYLFCIKHAELHKSELDHSMQSSLGISPISPRNQSKKALIQESVSKFISESEAVILAVRKICFHKLKRLKRGKGLSRVSFDIEKLIINLSKEGIIEKGSRIFTSEEIRCLKLEIESKEQRISELEKLSAEINRNSQSFYELHATISNMKQKNDKSAEIQELNSQIQEKTQRIAELEAFINDILSENENKQKNNEDIYIKKIKALEFDIKSRDEKIRDLDRIKGNLESDIKSRDEKIRELNRINANQIKSIKDFEKRLEEGDKEISDLKKYCSDISIENDNLADKNKYLADQNKNLNHSLSQTFNQSINQNSMSDRKIRHSVPIYKPIQGYQAFNSFSVRDKINFIKNNWTFITDYSSMYDCYISNDSNYLFICIIYLGKCKQMVT